MPDFLGNLPYHNPCRRILGDGTLEDASYSITGGYKGGGGVLFWAYSLEEAQTMLAVLKERPGYSELKIFNEKTQAEYRIPYNQCVFW